MLIKDGKTLQIRSRRNNKDLTRMYPLDTVGTITVRQETYETLVSDVARSMKAHGFENIVLMSDNGGSNQDGMNAILRRHGRISYSDIARELDTTRDYVASRVNPLIESGELRVIAAPHPRVLSLTVSAHR